MHFGFESKQCRNDKNKIYNLHESQVYCIAKGKDHKSYEYGANPSIVSTAKEGLILSVVSHTENIHDNKTLDEVIHKANEVRQSSITEAVCDRGCRGRKIVEGVNIVLPNRGLKRDNRYQRDKKRKQCRRRAAIEPIIGHLKFSYRLAKNYLKGSVGDSINLFMSACAWNLKKWMIKALRRFFCTFKTGTIPVFLRLRFHWLMLWTFYIGLIR